MSPQQFKQKRRIIRSKLNLIYREIIDTRDPKHIALLKKDALVLGVKLKTVEGQEDVRGTDLLENQLGFCMICEKPIMNEDIFVTKNNVLTCSQKHADIYAVMAGHKKMTTSGNVITPVI